MAGQVDIITETTRLLTDVDRALKAVDPSAYFVPPRILRRVIRHEHEVAGVGFQIPHRKSYVVSKDRLAFLVEPDELGLEDAEEFPESAILLAQPDEQRLPDLGLPELLSRVWRLLFHAHVHLAFDRLLSSGGLTLADIRERIDHIGQVEFDEMQAVIRQEHFLLQPARGGGEYVEVAAVYLELRMFAPHCLPAYFPALLGEFDRLDDVFAEDVDAQRLFAATRPAGAPFPVGATALATDRPLPAEPADAQRSTNGKSRPRAYARLTRKADKTSAQGNLVKAAILRTRAAKYGDAETAAAARAGAARELDELVRRLQAALGFDDEEARDWREAFDGLLAKSLEGFWRPDKRLLYDLQKVCVDHEREISKVDLAQWLFSFGRRPLKRLLPNQREVLMSKHLRRATDRLSVARLSGTERERLSHLLHDAAKAAERQMRNRLRPLVRQALDDVGLAPANVPERVSRNKLIEELLDIVARRGFIYMGNLRDALSRSQIKLADLVEADGRAESGNTLGQDLDDGASGRTEFHSVPQAIGRSETPSYSLGSAWEGLQRVGQAVVRGAQRLWRGDSLLQTDRRLGVLLDGVYRKGEFYLRFLQRLSSVAFGTRSGRFVTRYVAIPFGGAIILIEFAKHLLHTIGGDDHPLHHLGFGTRDFNLAIAALGGFLFGMIHLRPFRRLMWQVLKLTWQIARGVLFDLPRGFLGLELVRRIRRSRPYELFGRFVLKPAFLTAAIWLTLSLTDLVEFSPTWAGLTFVLLAVAVNSRISRDIEELTAERAHKLWHRIRVRVIVALFDLIMGAFKRLLEWIERVLYAVDEWLRFKSGETVVTLASKAALGAVWAVVAYVVRFCVTLLIEPQINPIKHFPVVTVSHKIILPLGLPGGPLSRLLAPLVGSASANAVAGTIVWGIPGIFGFLVWELKENWRLYAANRSPRLKPVLVGDHGETLPRLMRPGFHSGTLPKLYRKLRRAYRKTRPGQHNPFITRYDEKLHHNVDAIRHFLERELLGLLAASRACGHLRLAVGEIHVASNSVRVELIGEDGVWPAGAPRRTDCQSVLPLWLTFQEQSGWIVAGIAAPGWLDGLSDDCRQTFRLALAGLYQFGGVDLVREQLEDCFQPDPPPYDITDRGLVVWPDGAYETVVRYDLDQRPVMRPRPQTAARAFNLPLLEAHEALFGETEIGWREWVAVWDDERVGAPVRLPAIAALRLLPERPVAPARESIVQPAS